MDNTKGVMVCVTNQRSCEKLILRGAQRSLDDGLRPLYIVHCVQTGRNFMNTPYEADAIEYLFTCAQVVDAELTILRADDVEDALVEFAESHNVGVMVMGVPGENGVSGGKFAIRMQERLPEVEIDVHRGDK